MKNALGMLTMVAMFTGLDHAIGSPISSKLIGYLEEGANTVTVPVMNRSHPIHVFFNIKLMQIQEVHDSEQYLTAKYWVRMTWKNELMMWNPVEWGGIEEVPIDSRHVWTPDIVLYNNAGSEFSGGPTKYPFPVVVNYNGTTKWQSPATFTSSCRLHSEFFPIDGQACKLKFGSWTLNAAKLMMVIDKKSEIFGNWYVASPEWDLLEAKANHHSVCYEAYGNIPYDDITITIKVSRKGLSYLFYFVAPCFIVVCTTLFSFSLPPESGERMIIIVTNLLCFAIFLFMTSEMLPRNSNDVAMMSVFYIVFMTESSFSILMACCVLIAYHRGRSLHPPGVPAWLRALFVGPYTRIYGIENSALSSTGKKLKSQIALMMAPLLGDINNNLMMRSESTMTNNGLNCDATLEEAKEKEAALQLDQKSQVEELAMENNEIQKKIREELQFIRKVDSDRKRREALRVDWEVIGYMLDRIYFWSFLFIVVLSFITIMSAAVIARAEFGIPSSEDAHDEKGDDRILRYCNYGNLNHSSWDNIHG